MSDNRLIVGTRAIKMVNKGGGEMTVNVGKRGQGGKYVRLFRKVKVEGNPSYVFNCPACGSRNKQNILAGKKLNEERGIYEFACNTCCIRIEVSPPFDTERKIITLR